MTSRFQFPLNLMIVHGRAQIMSRNHESTGESFYSRYESLPVPIFRDRTRNRTRECEPTISATTQPVLYLNKLDYLCHRIFAPPTVLVHRLNHYTIHKWIMTNLTKLGKLHVQQTTSIQVMRGRTYSTSWMLAMKQMIYQRNPCCLQ